MPSTREALIITDIQNDFCTGGTMAVRGADEIIPAVNKLMADFPLIVLTQDWHPADHASFAANQTGGVPFTEIEMDYGRQTLWPAHCVQGTPGADFHPELDTDPAHFVLRKGYRVGIDSYSAFFENDRTTPTGLAGHLAGLGITQLTFVGLATDFCVAWSAIDAARAGFRSTVIESCCRAIDLDGSLAAARKLMRDAGVILVD